MKQKALSVSVVVPVYNEEDRIYDCLHALTRQSVEPLEIIVVDNNSTDQTVAIARRFKDVKILREPKQGLTYARNCGFTAARGDIIGRIDADTIVDRDWTKQVRNAFALDPSVSGITGYGFTRTGVTSPTISSIWSWAYFAHCKAFFGVPMMWGANMAVRRSAWESARPLICYDDSFVHEDQDLSLAFASAGLRVEIIPGLLVSVDFEDIQYFDKFWQYYKKKHSTRSIHQLHYRSKLGTNNQLPAHQRAMYHLAASHTVGLFMIITAVNSMIRYAFSASKQTSVYWWYQKIKSDLEF